MTDILRLNNNTPIWPYSVAQFRADEPHLSISDNPHDGELASYATLTPPIIVARPQPADPPEHDPATHQAREVMPIEVNGAWRQAWELVPLPPPVPPPDWLGFAGWLYQFPAIQSAMNAARASTTPQGEPATTGLPAAMDEARLRQNYPAFALSWGQFLLASNMAPADLAAIVAKAADCNLPAEFLAALQPEVVP